MHEHIGMYTGMWLNFQVTECLCTMHSCSVHVCRYNNHNYSTIPILQSQRNNVINLVNINYTKKRGWEVRGEGGKGEEVEGGK